ncbi:sigma-70 family RNA polymerase sigma factor [Prauserella cavernicola]|uniref:Sigma-70 family RNA polymerase sigma factor n=1 Tax=Prauserella cavernicola TaxID=2800127 RepID=A0A934QQW9_9PSEU|nr:sigma-70 family RNA polymerase sigma factor [Prauserella cavernicola]MBK1784443.1 sigma-70 family RNA polymerase sigma factor [Prauserella cavernicola]
MDRVTGSDEPALLARLRFGEDAAFGELFELHAAAVRRLARGLASDASEAEDITAETFFRVLQAVRRGNGPRDNVRAYLLTVARRVSWEWHGARRDVPVTDDELTSRVGVSADYQNRTAEATLITRAFSNLPERWKTVLWQTEVEGVQPANAAAHFGLSANATAALARRARLGLRAAYLQAHLAVNRSSDGCRTVVEKLGGYTAGSVTGSEARKIKAHLVTCASCRTTHDELRDVCSSLRAHAGVIVLLLPAAGLAMGAGSGLGAAGGVTGVTGAAGTVASGASVAAGGGAGGTALAAIGTNVKLGLALASTAAVGAVGVAAGPVNSDVQDSIGLPGEGSSVELQIAESTSVPVSRTPTVVPGTGVAEPGHVVDSSKRLEPEPAVEQGATEYSLPVEPEPVDLPGQGRAEGEATELPGVHVPPGNDDDQGEDQDGDSDSPRSDLPGESEPADTTMSSTDSSTSRSDLPSGTSDRPASTSSRTTTTHPWSHTGSLSSSRPGPDRTGSADPSRPCRMGHPTWDPERKLHHWACER